MLASASSPALTRRITRLALAAVLVTPTVAFVQAAAPVRADTEPPPGVTIPTVSSDPLPAPQINGVAEDMVIAGNRVYVTGEFTSARPAGSPPGSNQTPRSNILAFDLNTGTLISNWAPSLNGVGKAIVASADGSRIFVAGNFTQVSGTNHYRVAAIDAATGQVISTWNAGTNARVSALAISGDTLYLGGIFTTANNASRTRLAAVSASTGALLDWAPTAEAEVMALAAPAGSGKVVAGGKFTTLNGANWYGMGALDATTGANVPWAATATVRNAGANAAIYSLTTDGAQVYGTGYTFGSGGNFEGTFAASSATGVLAYVTGCRGDTYDAAAADGVLYHVGHVHECSQVAGGNPQTNPWTFQRAYAQTTTVGPDGARNFGGRFPNQPAPKLLQWHPTLDPGEFTGTTQAAWTVAANSDYVVLGGEFPRVNGIAQEGLVRFAVRSIAPNVDDPQGGTALTPTFSTITPGALRVSWTAAFDRDNERLTYEVLRGATLGSSTVVGRFDYDSNWWTRPTISFTDTAPPGGTTATYRIRVRDPLGNTIVGNPASFAVPAGAPTASTYSDLVQDDGAIDYWRLGEPSGTVGYDWATSRDLTLASGATRGAAGAISGDPNTATTFPGTATVPAHTAARGWAPSVFTVEAWFRTSSVRGGKIVGYGSSSTALSGTYDRHLYLTNTGQVVFGVTNPGVQAITSAAGLNDNQWHHVAGTLGPDGGMRLYVDGALAGTQPSVTGAFVYAGHWRVGGDQLNGWPNRPLNNALAGSIDEVAVYPTELSASQLQAHHAAGTGATVNLPPTASFTSSASNLTVSVNGSGSSDPDGSIASYAWDFGDGGTATGATASHTYAAAGTYPVTLTVTDNGGATDTTTTSVTVTAPPVNQEPTAAFTASTSGLTANLNGGTSSDPDGTIASYAWNFGDGDTGTGATASHTYAAGGTYTVTLTVTDDDGATDTASQQLTVTPPVAGEVVGLDAFGRTVASGFGTADTGGAWTTGGSGTTSSVDGGQARVASPAGRTATALLNGVSAANVDLTYQFGTDEALTGGGVYLSSLIRSTSSGDYRVKTRIQATGTVTASITRVVGGTETAITSGVTVPVTYATGSRLAIRVQANGASPTTLRYRIWQVGGTEPSTWLQTATDSTAGLQGAGAIGFATYASGSVTATPVVRYDNLRAERL